MSKKFKIFWFCIAIAGSMALGQKNINPGAIISSLNDSSSNDNRINGFRQAAIIDSMEVNNELVKLLNSKEEGGMVSDVLVLPSWHESLIILAERFPEAGIKKRPIAYGLSDAEKFKKWWTENRERIEYRNNTHVLIPEAQSQTRHMEVLQSASPPETTRTLDNKTELMPKLEPKGMPPPTSKKAQESKPADLTSVEELSSVTWWVVMIAVVGLLWLLLKKQN